MVHEPIFMLFFDLLLLHCHLVYLNFYIKVLCFIGGFFRSLKRLLKPIFIKLIFCRQKYLRILFSQQMSVITCQVLSQIVMVSLLLQPLWKKVGSHFLFIESFLLHTQWTHCNRLLTVWVRFWSSIMRCLLHWILFTIPLLIC